jgi:hypothetical protein
VTQAIPPRRVWVLRNVMVRGGAARAFLLSDNTT